MTHFTCPIWGKGCLTPLLVRIQADLAKVDRAKTPWLLVLFHVPWYNSNRAHQGEGDDMRASMEPLLYAAGTDLILTGHVHAYERTVSQREPFIFFLVP